MRMYGVSCFGGPPRCAGCCPWARLRQHRRGNENANRPAADAAWRCVDFTVLTSQTLNQDTPRRLLRFVIARVVLSQMGEEGLEPPTPCV